MPLFLDSTLGSGSGSGATGTVVYIGNWDASAGTFPGGGTAAQGAQYRVSVPGTVNGQLFDIGDIVEALVANPSTSTFAGNWLKGQGVVTSADISDSTSFGRSLLTAASVAAQVSALGLATVATTGAFADLASHPTTVSGYGITNALITANNLSDLTSASTARTNLGLGSFALLNTLANGYVTSAMLAGSIAASNLVGTDIATVGTLTAGTWNASVIGGQYGGTGVANTGRTITLAGNLATTGAFNTTFAQQATATFTLPAATDTLAGLGTAQTFTALQTFGSGLRINQTPAAISQAVNMTLNSGADGAGNIGHRISINMNGTTYWIPASTTAF